VVADVDADF